MSANLKIDNFSSGILTSTTTLSSDYAIGTGSIDVLNGSDYSTNDFIILGTPGNDGAEIIKITGVSANTISLTTNTTLTHNKYDAVTKIIGDKIKVYSAAAGTDNSTPADSSFSIVTGGTININVDNTWTLFTDANGSSNVWYKFTVYNSVSTAETSLADVTAVRGAGYGIYCAVEDIRNEAGLQNNPNITDAMLDLYRQDAQAEIDTTLVGTYTVPFTTPVNPMIAEITRKLAAGFALTRNYGPMNTLNTNNGQSKIDEARKLLENLNNKTQTLIDANGNDISLQSNAGVFNAWPDSTTGTDSSDPDNGVPRMFSTQDRY